MKSNELPNNLDDLKTDLDEMISKSKRNNRINLSEIAKDNISLVLAGVMMGGVARITNIPQITILPPLTWAAMDLFNPVAMIFNARQYIFYGIGAALPYTDKIITATQNYIS